MKYCKVISAVMGSVLLFIMVSVFVPVYADAQDFDKSIVTNIDEIITSSVPRSARMPPHQGRWKGEGKKGWTKRAPYDLPVDRQSFCGRTAEMTPVPSGHGRTAFSRRRGSAREENGNTEQHDPAPSAGIQEQHDAGKAV